MELDLQKGSVIPRLRDWGKTALIHRGKSITYKELIDNINSFAYLLDTAVGERVAIISENRPEWVYAFYAIWQRGAVAVPIDFMSSPEEIQYILKETEPSAVCFSSTTEQNLLRALQNLSIRPQLLNLDKLSLEVGKLQQFYAWNLNDNALILYTSGTTGEPKGVMLSFKNLLSNIKAIEKLGIATQRDTTLALLPFHHSYPLMTTMLLPLHIGATVVFIEKLSSEELIKAMKEHAVTILVGVPRLYQLIEKRIRERVEESKLGEVLIKLSGALPKGIRKLIFWKVHKSFGGHLRFLVSGGAKLPLETALFLDKLGFTILEGYGLTETSPIVSFNPPWKIKLGSVGVPIEEVHVKIAQDGEVMVRGVNVMLGYFKKPEETQRAFKDGWLLTGDLGYMDQDGYLYITGRKKEIIVLSGGKKVNPEEIENLILTKSDLIKEVGVLEVDGSLHALIFPDFEKLRERGILNMKEYIKWNVIDKVNRELAEWKRITGFKLIDRELPKTRLGKLRRFLLPKLYASAEEIKEESKIDIPSTPEWLALSEFIQRLSGKEPKPSDHIEIDLGLDSLAKVELLSFIETTFGIRLEEEDLVQHSVLYDLLKLISEKKERVQVAQVDWASILKDSPPYRLEHHPLIFRIGRLILYVFFKLYNRLEVKNLQNLPKPPFILAANHASYLDGFVLACALPERIAQETYFLGEEGYFKNPLTSLFGRLAHVITVNLDKKLKESLQKTAWALRLGKVVVIFPEGARTRDGKLLPFKKGFAILSRELGIPIVPTALIGTYESMSIKDKLPKPKKIKVVFGEPILPQGMSYEEIVQETKTRIEALLKEYA
ncbi:AMP-binding protein [Hydrogenobacter hydrogenophilus]|uniref:Long-chain acyl-CoA synthetase n=1 Tax=Hydrogenobacter hydrogenophilus TaxID=35835 RepID=A0A285P4U3_9AQUI|nr:AMP-binding protein [Hydrogenobacter hydrogenophilus]SNZ15186.1 long-chain acyl-CoA synthetase [Hydrogenobacter hydrogenophilus]